jgi:hypothetical protein
MILQALSECFMIRELLLFQNSSIRKGFAYNYGSNRYCQPEYIFQFQTIHITLACFRDDVFATMGKFPST